MPSTPSRQPPARLGSSRNPLQYRDAKEPAPLTTRWRCLLQLRILDKSPTNPYDDVFDVRYNPIRNPQWLGDRERSHRCCSRGYERAEKERETRGPLVAQRDNESRLSRDRPAFRRRSSSHSHAMSCSEGIALSSFYAWVQPDAKSEVASEPNKSERSEHSLNRLTTSAIVRPRPR